jgi:hypothetical protein
MRNEHNGVLGRKTAGHTYSYSGRERLVAALHAAKRASSAKQQYP